MRKIIGVICWIFILWLIVENFGFVFSQSEIIEDNQTNEIVDVDGLATVETYNEWETQHEENPSPLIMLRWVPNFWISQTIQKIDTSDYGIIRIKDPNNTWKWITLLDRNLWATATWAWVDETRQSFWYYFQWWNNYWFSSDSSVEISISPTQVDTNEYWPNTENEYYSSDTFIIWNNDWSSVRNDNLWWWSWDSRYGNGRWYPVTNAEDRRWPCPEDYHVPSIWEWSKVLEFWAAEYSGVALEMEDNGLYKFKNNIAAFNAFNQRFYLPIAGQRDKNSIILYPNIQFYLWTSSPANSNEAFRLYWNSSDMFFQNINYRSFAFPIRCFYNSYRLPVKITYDVNWWYWVDDDSFQELIVTYIKENDNSEYSWDVSLWKVKRNNNCWENEDKKCMFGWWYTLTGDEMWTWNIAEDITLYAKWLSYEDKSVFLSGTTFTIMDRNLWAKNSWIEEDAYWYYLTWWENDVLCPEWYHIPSTWEWLWIKYLLGLDFDWNLVKNIFNLPFAGKVENNKIVDWENGYYLAKNGDYVMYAKIDDSGIEIKNLDGWEKVLARCFKDYNIWIIKFDSKWWNDVENINAVNRREGWEELVTPVRENSIFLGWFGQNDTKIETNINYNDEKEINLYAKWKCEEWYQEVENRCEKISRKSGWHGGWTSKNSVTQSWLDWNDESGTWQTNIIPSDTSPVSSEWQDNISPWTEIKNSGNMAWINSLFVVSGWKFTQEFVDAYNFAYKYWITTKQSIEDAKMYSSLTRIQMAKMLSYFAINALWKKPDISKWVIKFIDVPNKLNMEYNNAVTLAYQLWIMWQNIKENKFRPYDEVNRAELATALSRLLYWTEDWRWETKYYGPHIAKLYNEWVISNINPKMKENRWYVMIILAKCVP